MALAEPIEFAIGYLLSEDIIEKTGDTFTWYALINLIEFILDVTKKSNRVLALIERCYTIFQNSKSDEIYRLAKVIITKNAHQS